MTRETKIGLLVGLAFIIVIGILLSDYNRNEIQSADPRVVAETVRSSTATPHNGSTQSEIVPPPAPIAPTRPIPTPADLHHEQVAIVPPTPNTVGPTLSARGNEESPAHPTGPVVADPPLPGPDHIVPAPTGPTGIPDTEAYQPHRPVTRDPGSMDAVTPPPAPRTPPVAPASPTVNGAKQYVAVAGDTLNKLAGRFLGGNTKANRDAILAINPSLKANPNSIIVGKMYMIPAKGSVAAAGPSTPTPATPTARPAPVVADAEHTSRPPGGYYTVKDKDSLWKIAADQLGDGNSWKKIAELNPEVGPEGEKLHANMKLKMPAKAVASTN